MDPVSLIGGIGSILGGLFGRSESVSAGSQAYSHVDGIVKAADKFGFNPLTLLGAVPAMGGIAGSNASLGQGIADGFAMFGQGLADKWNARQAQEAEAAKQENLRLKQKVVNATLRPDVGGVYANPVSSVVEANKDNGASIAPYSLLGFNRGLSSTDLGDNRREVSNQPIKSTAGFMVIDNPHLPYKAYVPTLDGDEPLQWYDYPSLAVPAASVVGQSLIHPDGWYRRYIGKPFERGVKAIWNGPKATKADVQMLRDLRAGRVAW